MHGAPSVNYPVGRSRLGLAIACAAWFAGVLAVAAWAWQVQPSPVAVAGAALLVLAAGVCGFAGWWRSPRGTLAWDGQAWTWEQVEGEVESTIDLQRWLLLRFRGSGAARWLWLDRASAPGRWDDLRRAVYSRARPQALPRA